MASGEKARRILIYRIGSLGDTIVALPCFHLIQRQYPDAERVLLTNFPVHAKAPASAAVLANSGLVDGYMQYKIGTRSPRQLFKLAAKIRRFKPDVLIYLMPMRRMDAVRRDAWFFKVAGGVKQIIGLPAKEDPETALDPSSGLFESEASRLSRMIGALGNAAPDDIKNWDLRLTQLERDTGRAVLGDLEGGPFLVCGPGTKMQAKDWGKENWRALIQRLANSYPGFGLAIVGAREEAITGEYVSSAWPGRKINLCGQLDLRGTAAVLEHASVFIGPDSGPMHLASCVGVPCVIAFSARGLPGVWYPFGSRHRVLYKKVDCFGCNLESCVIEARKCLTSITVEEMAAAVDSVLSNRTADVPT